MLDPCCTTKPGSWLLVPLIAAAAALSVSLAWSLVAVAMSGAHGGWSITLDSMEMKLQMVWSYHVGTGS